MFPLSATYHHRGWLLLVAIPAFAALACGGAIDAATVPAFDMTGHWTGAYSSHKQNGKLSADFTAAAGLKSFTGTFTVLDATGQQIKDTYSVQGLLSKTNKVTVQLTSNSTGQANTAVVAGALNRVTRTVKGTFHSQGPGGGNHGTFVLTKQ